MVFYLGVLDLTYVFAFWDDIYGNRGDLFDCFVYLFEAHQMDTVGIQLQRPLDRQDLEEALRAHEVEGGIASAEEMGFLMSRRRVWALLAPLLLCRVLGLLVFLFFVCDVAADLFYMLVDLDDEHYEHKSFDSGGCGPGHRQQRAGAEHGGGRGGTDPAAFGQKQELQHCHRLLMDAIEEALQWLLVPPTAVAFNAASQNQSIWSVISWEASHGSGPSDERARHWVRGPSVLLQPNFPDTLAQLSEAFPGTPEEAVAGYRRRVWRHHVQWDAVIFVEPGHVLVLFRSRPSSEELTEEEQKTDDEVLSVAGAKGVSATTHVAEFSSTLTPRERKVLLKRFRQGKVKCLVCSDVVARGIDIPAVSAVVNYTAPSHLQTYIHRVGRTARAGKIGHTFTFVASGDHERFMAMLQQSADCWERISKFTLPRSARTEPPWWPEALEMLQRCLDAESKGRLSVARPFSMEELRAAEAVEVRKRERATSIEEAGEVLEAEDAEAPKSAPKKKRRNQVDQTEVKEVSQPKTLWDFARTLR
eukprot:s2865_g2.t2